ncbi:hypothetical protein [Planctobacterium marinum]|uniref:hypothetical protein n=1 Tax=Planctobacterium marinum TaxID=1631968 RepID=UPI001E46608A|nr:hypothetical protein [Planctobacterium marinum]MCC2606855.1 hypothetical protein [Planctobacterium marinum]
MQVQSAQIQFAHQHERSERYTKSETLLAERAAQQQGDPATRTVLLSERTDIQRSEQALGISANDKPQSPVTDLSQRGRALAAQIEQAGNRAQGFTAFLRPEEDELSDSHLDAKIWQLKSVVESFIGREIHLHHLQEEQESPDQSVSNGRNNQRPPTSSTAELIYQYQESYQEDESSLFIASGEVTLQSGETIQLELQQFTQRSFYQANSLEMKIGEIELTDPLVINLQGASVSLSQRTHQFDLDQDGQQDTIHFATGQSGFLALDRNNNSLIDDGSELFGAKTGNGFAELAQYDEDQNGFIDAGDSVFSRLQFYQKNALGEDQLSNISELGIGALYLGQQASPFDIKDADNQLQAKVRSSGLFINNNGTVGSLQQIDLVV